MRIKLAITGSHSTGKTSLIDALQSHHGNVRIKVIGGVARGVIKRGFNMAKEATMDSFANYIRDQLMLQRQAVELDDWDFLLVDRCIACAIGYASVNQSHGVAVPGYFVSMMEEVARLERSFFDAYVYLPIEFPFVADGIRPEDDSYRAAVSDAILTILQRLQFPTLIVKGAVDERRARVYNLFERLSKGS